jgi:CDP-diacylglycerol---glycerol-3-phosphate 3-phosphatidyltransferase
VRVIDLAASSVVGCAALAAALAWTIAGRGHALHADRVAQAGSSVLLGPTVQQAAYWAGQPLGRALVRAGVTANAITVASIPLAAGAAVALAEGHYGVGALLGGWSYACDALDGLVARSTGTASDAGEVLDAVCDRICEALMLGGLAVAWRSSVPLLALALLAGLGAQQVTLASAKADVFPAARGRVPRGVMRRAERAAYFVGAAAMAGALLDLLPPVYARTAAQVPLVLAMGLVAVLGNASALLRFSALARVLERRPIEVHRAGE